MTLCLATLCNAIFGVIVDCAQVLEVIACKISNYIQLHKVQVYELQLVSIELSVKLVMII